MVGNGAAELINALMSSIDGRIDIVKPTFEEYPNRYKGEIVAYMPPGDDFSYTADDLKEYFSGKDISALFLINPDNPSGNYIPMEQVRLLADWAAKTGIVIIVDESFSDFADDSDRTLLDSSYISENPHLTVIKSISKSHGVPGIRLGIAVSGNTELIEEISDKISIWTINSFGEFYMQIFEKYRGGITKDLLKCSGRSVKDFLCCFPKQTE